MRVPLFPPSTSRPPPPPLFFPPSYPPMIMTPKEGENQQPSSSTPETTTSEPEITSVIIFAILIAVMGTLAILAIVTFYRRNRLNALRKQYSSSSTSSFQKYDTTKVPPPPLISSNQSVMKPLPLIPLNSSTNLSSSDTTHSQIYSEIDDQIPTSSMNYNPLINQLSKNNINTLNYSQQLLNHHHLHQSPQVHPTQSRVIPPVSYPPFFTFNTVGRNKTNPYIYTPDSMGPRIHHHPPTGITCSPAASRGWIYQWNDQNDHHRRKYWTIIFVK